MDGAGVDGTVDAGPVDGGTADEVSDGPAPDGCAPDVPNVLSPAMGSRGMGLIFSMVTMGFFVLGLGVVFGLGVASGGNSGLWALYVLAAGCYRCIGGWVQQNQMGVSEKKGIPYFGALKTRILLLGVLYQGPLFSETPKFQLGGREKSSVGSGSTPAEHCTRTVRGGRSNRESFALTWRFMGSYRWGYK